MGAIIGIVQRRSRGRLRVPVGPLRWNQRATAIWQSHENEKDAAPPYTADRRQCPAFKGMMLAGNGHRVGNIAVMGSLWPPPLTACMTWPIRQERRGTREAHSNPTGAVCSLSRLPPTRSRIILIRSVDFITALLHLCVCRFHWPAMAQRLVPRRESDGCARSWSIRVDSHRCAGRLRRRSISSLRPSPEAT